MKTFSTIQDFLQDKSFVEWVLNPDSPKNRNWEEMAENREHSLLINQAKHILLELDMPGKDWEVQDQMELLSKIHRHLAENKQKVPKPFKATHSNGLLNWKRVNVLLFICFVLFFAFLAIDIVTPKKVEEVAIVESTLKWVTKFNPKGQKSKIHLPDGSTVIINAESEIKFRSDFGETNRDIYLVGESFFEVAPDSLLPFIVYSEDLITTALGTSFNINSYNPDRIQVQLATGKVEVKSVSTAIVPIFLHPGEELTVIENKKLKKGKFNPKKAFLWKSGILLFDNFSLNEFKVTLERWYGVEMELINPPASPLKISGEFKDTYLSNVLESVGYAYGFDYKIDQKKVTLTFTP